MDVIRVAADDETSGHLKRGSHVRGGGAVSVWFDLLVCNTQLTSSVTGTIKQVDKCHPIWGSNPLLPLLLPPYVVAQAGRYTYPIRLVFDYRKYWGSIW